MAYLRKGNFLLDNIKGNLGGLVFRQRNGKTIISQRPTSYTISKKEKSVMVRNKFRTAAKFALFLNKIPAITKLWKFANIEGQHNFHKLLKYNLKHVTQFWPSKSSSITPPLYSIKIQEVILFDDHIGVILEENDYPNDFQLHLVIVLYNKVQPDLEDFLCVDLSPQDSNMIRLNMTEFKLYNRFNLYCAVSGQEGKELLWSNTFVIDGDFEVYDN